MANGLIVIRRNRAHLCDHFAGDGLGELIQFALGAFAGLLVELTANQSHRFLDAALHRHWIGAGSNRLHAFAINCLGENRCSGSTVAGNIRGFGSHFANHLGAHVLQAVLEFDFFGNGNAVLGDGRRTEFLFDDNVAALGAEGNLYCVGKKIDAAQNCLPGLFSVYDLFCHDAFLLFQFCFIKLCHPERDRASARKAG